MITFEEATQPIVNQFLKHRITNFVKKHNIDVNDVEVVNEIPIEMLEKDFKKTNKIRTRLYKNMNEEQQQAWLAYYNEHKKLSLKVKPLNADAEPTVEPTVEPQIEPTVEPMALSTTTKPKRVKTTKSNQPKNKPDKPTKSTKQSKRSH